VQKQDVINQLKKLAFQLKPNQYLTAKDVRSIPKLGYYIYIHFRTLGKALKAANLPSSDLAAKMSIDSKDLLSYLKDLRSELGTNPKVWDINHDNKLYKKYSDKKFTWRIYKTRFGGLKKALEMIQGNKATLIKDLDTTQRQENPEFFLNKNRFFGKAAELHVTAELLYRGFQAANIPIDEGLDVLAVKSNKTFYFQVKHKDISNNEGISVTKSSFEKRGGGDVYYIFVLLSEKKREFLVVPYHIIDDWIRQGLADEKGKDYILHVRKIGEEYKLKNIVLNKYLDGWDSIK